MLWPGRQLRLQGRALPDRHGCRRRAVRFCARERQRPGGLRLGDLPLADSAWRWCYGEAPDRDSARGLWMIGWWGDGVSLVTPSPCQMALRALLGRIITLARAG